MPDVLLLDEPFSALDNPLRVEMRAFLLQIRKDFDIPVVLVTHDVVEANTMPVRLLSTLTAGLYRKAHHLRSSAIRLQKR